VVDCCGTIVAGHGRWLAARLLEIHEIPVICLDELTAEQAAALRIADNRLTEKSAWDTAILAGTLKSLSETALDFNLEVTGFSVPEIDLLIEGLSTRTDDELADEIPPASRQSPVSVPSDCWVLGRHRIICADALDVQTYERLMQHDRAAMVLPGTLWSRPMRQNTACDIAITCRSPICADTPSRRSEPSSAFLPPRSRWR